ncbi:hypothetical protein V8F33_013571 [Rhypophila sp. PSN 637]
MEPRTSADGLVLVFLFSLVVWNCSRVMPILLPSPLSAVALHKLSSLSMDGVAAVVEGTRGLGLLVRIRVSGEAERRLHTSHPSIHTYIH